MREEIIIAGSGGQGIMSLGNLLCYIATSQNKHTTFFPSYGAEIRGGTASCSVIISDDEIGSPVISNPSILVVMNEQSYNKFSSKIKSGGLVFVNSSLVSWSPRESEDALHNKSSDVFYIPATQIALQLGNIRTANTVMLGKFISVTKMFPIDAVCCAIKDVLGDKKNILDINLSAFMEGTKL